MQSFDCHHRAWRLHKEALRSFLVHRSGCAAEADDLLQEVFVRVVAQGAAFCEVENPRAWLFHVARNLLVDRLRSAKAQIPLPDDLCSEAAQESEPIEPIDLLSHCLPRVLSELSLEDRAAIVSCDIEGMAQKTFAERQGLTLPAAKSRVLRARRRLRAQLSAACQLKFDEQGKLSGFVPRPLLDE